FTLKELNFLHLAFEIHGWYFCCIWLDHCLITYIYYASNICTFGNLFFAKLGVMIDSI
ncbi:hypothetical protein L9F63_007718, partial [Diploptera punctata]